MSDYSNAVLYFSTHYGISNDSHKSVQQEPTAATVVQHTMNRRKFNTRWQYAFAKYLSEVPVDKGKYSSSYCTISWFSCMFRHTVFLWFALK